MIDALSYTAEQMDLLYSVVEDAVENKKPIDMFKISHVLKIGDFFLRGDGANGLHFQFNGLKWVKDGDIYNCLIQPQVTRNVFPEWYPIISYNDRNNISSGNLSMIKKENRYNQMIEHGWSNTVPDNGNMLAKQAKREIMQMGYTKVRCPKCNGAPDLITTSRGERTIVLCDCGYVHDLEINL